MRELRAIIAREESRRNELLDLWDNLTEEKQVDLVSLAREFVAQLDDENR